MTTNGDNPETGPQTIDQYLAAMSDKPEAPLESEETAEAATEAAEVEGEAPETPDAPEPAEDSDGPQVLTADEYGDVLVKVGDQTITLNDLHGGYLRQQDYSRKTQELSEARKEMQAEWEKLQSEREQLNRLRDQQLIGLDEPEPDWEKVAEEDPLGLPLKMKQWEKKQAEKYQAYQRQQQQAEQMRAQVAQHTAALAVERMPEWSQPGAFEKGSAARRKAALDAGFSDQEYNAAVDFRFAVLLEKAAKYDALQAGKPQVAKKVAGAPRVLKPGQVSTKADRVTADRAAKSKILDRPHSIEEHLAALRG